MRRLLATAFLTVTASTALLMRIRRFLGAGGQRARRFRAAERPARRHADGQRPGDTVPDATTPGTLPLVPVPSACTAPPQPEIVFVGTLVERDFRTGRFEIEQVRAGSEDPFAVGGLIDVRYGLDVEYLDIGTEYLVSAPSRSRHRLAGVEDPRARPAARR